MRLSTFALIALLALPFAARATPLVDDVVVAGGGHTVAFKLPVIQPYSNPVGANEFQTAQTFTNATLDGVGGYFLDTFLYGIVDSNKHPLNSGIYLYVFSAPGGASPLLSYTLGGGSLLSWNGPLLPSTVITLVPGMDTLTSTAPPYGETFNATITPETTPSTVPEPGSFGLLLTGLTGLLLVLRPLRSFKAIHTRNAAL